MLFAKLSITSYLLAQEVASVSLESVIISLAPSIAVSVLFSITVAVPSIFVMVFAVFLIKIDFPGAKTVVTV